MTEDPRRPGFIGRITPVDEEATRERVRRAELRREFLVPIYFMHTSSVPPAEARAALLGVADALVASGQERQIVNLGSESHGQGAFSNPDWYVAEAQRRQALRRDVGFGPQVDVGEVARLFGEEPWQEQPHWEVFVVNEDLNAKVGDRYINFVFGSTDTFFPSSVQSIRRITGSEPPGEMRNMLIRRLLRHEVGHMFGLPRRTDRNVEESLGSHCTNVCTMRQGLSIPEWKGQALQEAKQRVHFCRDCQADLASVRDKYKPIPKQ